MQWWIPSFLPQTKAHSSSCRHLVLFIMFSYSTLIPTQTMPRFSRLRSGGGYMRISSQHPLVHYIFMYVCAYLFWLISFYLWLVLVFLFSRVSYECTPLRHCMSRHYTSRQPPFLGFQGFVMKGPSFEGVFTRPRNPFASFCISNNIEGVFSLLKTSRCLTRMGHHSIQGYMGSN